MSNNILSYSLSGNIVQKLFSFKDYCYSICNHPSWKIYPANVLLFIEKNNDKSLSLSDYLEFQKVPAQLSLNRPAVLHENLVVMQLEQQISNTEQIESTSRQNINWMPFYTNSICLGIWDSDISFETVLNEYANQIPFSFFPDFLQLSKWDLSESPWESFYSTVRDKLPVRKILL